MVLPPSARRPACTFLSTDADDADRVDPAVVEEALILDGDDRLDQILARLRTAALRSAAL